MNEINKGKVTVKFEDGRSVTVPYKTKIADVIKMVENDLNKIIGIKVNNEVKSFDYEVVTDSICEYIDFDSEDGYRIYARTLKMVLYMALTKLYSHADVQFISTIDKDQYFIIKNIDLTKEKVAAIKDKMIDIIKKDLKIVKKVFGDVELNYNWSTKPLKNINVDEIINDKRFVGLRDPIINYQVNLKKIQDTKLYLYITDKPDDKLRLSISKYNIF